MNYNNNTYVSNVKFEFECLIRIELAQKEEKKNLFKITTLIFEWVEKEEEASFYVCERKWLISTFPRKTVYRERERERKRIESKVSISILNRIWVGKVAKFPALSLSLFESFFTISLALNFGREKKKERFFILEWFFFVKTGIRKARF